MFQSTRPRGARPQTRFRHCDRVLFQSTRPRGARPPAAPSRFGRRCFNPRAREGRDRYSSESSRTPERFQSTRPRGARPSPAAPSRFGRRCFNPRAREGRDARASALACASSCVSIHAPARGATCMPRMSSANSKFQSTRPRGARLGREDSGGNFKMFQSTRPRGARPARQKIAS